MNLRLIKQNGHEALEGPPGASLLDTVQDAVDLVGTCFEHRVHALLLYAENLTGRFFDLSSGEAGEIVQKLRNYHIKLAVIVSVEELGQTGRFREMAAEESKGKDFHIFHDRESAISWLTSD